MQQAQQNRKLILQQLLQKSQLFGQYIKDESTLASLLIQKRRNQPVQFGKCEINLPQRVKQQGKFLCNKLMVLTKSKKQAQKMKEKYDYLQRLKQAQTYEKGAKITSCHERSESRDQLNIKNSEQIEIRSQYQQVYYSNNNPQYPLSFSPEYQTFSPVKQRTFEPIRKNRSSSAKVRPHLDLFTHFSRGDGAQLQKPQHQARKKTLDQEQGQKMHVRNQKSSLQKQQDQVSLANVAQQIRKERENKKTQLSQHQNYLNHQVRTPKSQQISIRQRPSLTQKPQVTQDIQYLMLATKRSTSFSIKRHPVSSITPTLLINKNYQQLQQQQKKNKINLRRQLHKTYKRAFIPPPKISSKAYTIYEMKRQGDKQSGKILHAMNGKMAQEVASLTKIMTCIIVLEIAEKFQCKLQEEVVQIGRFQTGITGTSAQIKMGQLYSIEQLLYGLMLPSGNDASLALGVWGGKMLLQASAKEELSSRTRDNSESPSLLVEGKKLTKRDYIQHFVEQMNTKAQLLQMTRTNYANTHGLVNSENKSSAIDIALLCEYAMNNETFAKIVSTPHYSSVISYKQTSPLNKDQNTNSTTSQQLSTREITYQNTHYLLHRRPNEYIGIKTGVTTAAGPCLASCVFNKDTGRKFIIVVLNCKSMSERFKETEILKRWLYKQENIPFRYKKAANKNKTISQKQQRNELQETDMNSDEEEFSCDDKIDEKD